MLCGRGRQGGAVWKEESGPAKALADRTGNAEC